MDPDFRSLEDLAEDLPRRAADRRSWMRDNWMALVMLVAWIVAQIFSGAGWVHARETTEGATKADVDRLRNELQQLPATYVRQDVFTQVLMRIEARLTSLDNKTPADRR